MMCSLMCSLLVQTTEIFSTSASIGASVHGIVCNMWATYEAADPNTSTASIRVTSSSPKFDCTKICTTSINHCPYLQQATNTVTHMQDINTLEPHKPQRNWFPRPHLVLCQLNHLCSRWLVYILHIFEPDRWFVNEESYDFGGLSEVLWGGLDDESAGADSLIELNEGL